MSSLFSMVATDRSGHTIENDFEADVRELFQEGAEAEERFSARLYAALCNIEWQRDGAGYSMTWRAASSLVGRLVGGVHDLGLYCSGGEGMAAPEVSAALGERGWKPETDRLKWLDIPLPGTSDSS